MSDPPEIPDFFLETRNSPEAHRRNYAEAQREHSRVLKAALHVFDLHQLAEAQREIEENERRRAQLVAEEARRHEAERQAKIKQLEDEARLAAQKAAPLPRPVVTALPPSPPLPPPPTELKRQPQPPPQPSAQTASQPKPTTISSAVSNPFSRGAPSLFAMPSTVKQEGQLPTEKYALSATPAPFGNGTATGQNKNDAAAPAKAVPSPTHISAPPGTATMDRHIQIHKNLKDLRKFVSQQAKSNPQLKNRMGDMRRDIRKSFGQLGSGGLKENRIPVKPLSSESKPHVLHFTYIASSY